MDVKQINPSSASNITAATETRDGDRQRERNLKRKNQQNKSAAQMAPPAPPSEPLSPDTAPSPADSQMLDSEKVVALLSHRPRAHAKSVATFSRHAVKPNTKNITFPDGKKLNKAL